MSYGWIQQKQNLDYTQSSWDDSPLSSTTHRTTDNANVGLLENGSLVFSGWSSKQVYKTIRNERNVTEINVNQNAIE